MAWCCEGFGFLIDNDIDKGLSVFASKKYGKNAFYLQACPFDKKIVSELSKINPQTGLTKFSEIKTPNEIVIFWNMSMEMGINYCMFCGKKLSTVIKKKQKEFDMLAEKHLKLLEKYFNEPRG